MRALPVILCLLLSAASPAAAAEQQEMIFREDSGLTKTEYLLAVGKFSAALDTANEVLIRHPANADAYTYRGYAYSRLGQRAKAAEDFSKALQIDPAHLGANKYLADLYLEDGEVSRALEQLQVIRMTCGHTDCAELRALERAIDRYKSGELPKKDSKETK